MDIQNLTQFFMWYSIINGVLLMVTFLFCAYAGDFAYRLHGRWFPMPRETFTVVLYSFIGLYKIIFIVFNLVPYLVLLMMA